MSNVNLEDFLYRYSDYISGIEVVNNDKAGITVVIRHGIGKSITASSRAKPNVAENTKAAIANAIKKFLATLDVVISDDYYDMLKELYNDEISAEQISFSGNETTAALYLKNGSCISSTNTSGEKGVMGKLLKTVYLTLHDARLNGDV